jgi:predicted small lipoprotein YifL
MRVKLILTLIIMALLLSACGKKGPVRPLTKAVVEQPAALPEERSGEQKKQSN